MAEIVWKLVRWGWPVALFWALVHSSWYTTGWSYVTWTLIAVAVAVTISWPIWGRFVYERFEKPAYRKECLELAAIGISDVLFLRSFTLDSYLSQLQESLFDALRSHNAQNASFMTLVAIGNPDQGAVPKFATDKDWWEECRQLAKSVLAILILPLNPGGTRESGISREVELVLGEHRDKTIFVMPPLDFWTTELKGSPLEGQLEGLWEQMVEGLERRKRTMPKYDRHGCYFTLHEDHNRVYHRKYSFDGVGLGKALSTVLEEQRFRRGCLEIEAKARNKLMKQSGLYRPSTMPDDELL